MRIKDIQVGDEVLVHRQLPSGSRRSRPTLHDLVPGTVTRVYSEKEDGARKQTWVEVRLAEVFEPRQWERAEHLTIVSRDTTVELAPGDLYCTRDEWLAREAVQRVAKKRKADENAEVNERAARYRAQLRALGITADVYGTDRNARTTGGSREVHAQLRVNEEQLHQIISALEA